MVEIVTGLASGASTIFLARLTRSERWLYALGLVTLPLIYAAFALHAGQDSTAGLELLWGLPYLAGGILLSVFSLRKSTALVGALWFAHGLYDLTHGHLFNNAGVPGWYPAFCAAVDLVVGVYLLALSARLPELKSGRA